MKKLIFKLLLPTIIFCSCQKEEGCIDSVAVNFNMEADEDDGSCIYGILGYWDLYSIYYEHQSGFNVLPGESDLEFVEGGTLYEHYDYYDTVLINEWIIIGDSIQLAINGEDFTYKYDVTKTDLTLIGNTNSWWGPALTTINCIRQ
jgi:hypothetical protein|tara:strand:+ start:483 stop:920 length:438 start_codon:yes stop_codon:yes gene_type:complete